jgi:hypothetical protein
MVTDGYRWLQMVTVIIVTINKTAIQLVGLYQSPVAGFTLSPELEKSNIGAEIKHTHT